MRSARPELLEQARIGFERAEDEYRRMKMLYDSKSLAPNDFQKYKAAYEHAKQDYEQAKAGGQREDKDLAKASYNQSAAHLEVARKALSDATLRAPTNGYIAKRSIEPGDTAAPGHPVFEIVQMDPVEVNVGVPETDVHLVRIGQKAEHHRPRPPGEVIPGDGARHQRLRGPQHPNLHDQDHAWQIPSIPCASGWWRKQPYAGTGRYPW